jgi:predicted ribosomally synthesized peptide with SipW-like signal peptide
MNSKKLPVVILSLLLLTIMAYGTVGTGAWFTDRDMIVGNTATAGKLDIDVRTGGSTVLPIELENIAPGEWYGPYEIHVYNQNTPVSTMPVKYRFYDANSTETVGGFYDLMRVKVDHSHAGPNNCVGWPTVFGPQPLGALDVRSPAHSIAAPSGELGVNITHVYCLYFKLHESAGNPYQGASATFDLVFDATQINNPGWTE